MKILHLEDNPSDALIIERGIQRQGIPATFIQARGPSEYSAALQAGGFDVVLVDNNLPGYSAEDAIVQAKTAYPDVPVIVCSGAALESEVAASFAAGADDYVLKDHLWQLSAALRRNIKPPAPVVAPPQAAMMLLVDVEVYQNLERQVRERTRELQTVNQELEAFSSAVSHDLRAPLRIMNAELDMAREHAGVLPASSVARLRDSTTRMGSLIDDLLRLSQITRTELYLQPIDLSEIAGKIVTRLRNADPQRDVEVSIAPGLKVTVDTGLMSVALENLLSNAWKYSSKRERARIELSSYVDGADRVVYQVQDNGAGFNPNQTDRLFKPFTRLHDARQFPGVGIGLATVQRIVQRHGGDIWATSDGRTGAQFMFTLGEQT